MKFNEIKYNRPDFEQFQADFKLQLTAFSNADSFESANAALLELYKLRHHFSTMYQVAMIRFTSDTRDEVYQKENSFYDEVNPTVEKLVNDFYDALIQSDFKEQFTDKYGQHLIDFAELSIKGINESVLSLMQEENKLKSEYQQLKGKAQIEFNGQSYNLGGIEPLIQDLDESVRIGANEAKWQFFADNQQELDSIFDQLVKKRHEIAQKLGFKNYVELGYIKMMRFDFDQADAANFRASVVKHIVPLARKMRAQQMKMIGIETLQDHNSNFYFKDGNPKPIEGVDEILKEAQKMYAELSPETASFFNQLMDGGFTDLQNRPGKADVGYCTSLEDYQLPYIFGNFNGTSFDTLLLTHEAGHAFQYYSSASTPIYEYRWPTFEACEVHSMSMEYLTYPWMKNFYGDDLDKFFYQHFCQGILKIPSLCLGDHFQEVIYEQPNLSPIERAEIWKELSLLYNPDLDFSSIEYLNEGRYWQRIGHFYESPFYFLDYALAQTCALQFWKLNEQNSKATWKKYLKLCQLGGKHPFLKLVEMCDLNSPFEENTVKEVALSAAAHFDSFKIFEV